MNFTDRLLNEYLDYTSNYIGQEDANAKEEFKKALANRILDVDAFHRAFDTEIDSIGLLGIFKDDGMLKSRGTYGDIKNYKDQSLEVIKYLKKFWAAQYSDFLITKEESDVKLKAKAEIEEKIEKYNQLDIELADYVYSKLDKNKVTEIENLTGEALDIEVKIDDDSMYDAFGKRISIKVNGYWGESIELEDVLDPDKPVDQRIKNTLVYEAEELLPEIYKWALINATITEEEKTAERNYNSVLLKSSKGVLSLKNNTFTNLDTGDILDITDVPADRKIIATKSESSSGRPGSTYSDQGYTINIYYDPAEENLVKKYLKVDLLPVPREEEAWGYHEATVEDYSGEIKNLTKHYKSLHVSYATD